MNMWNPRSLQGRWPWVDEALLRLAHRWVLARLRAEARWSARPFARRQPRAAVTACWRFPIYSQTFVQQEVAALARGGFELRFFHAETGPRSELSHACAVLWGLRRRLVLHRLTGLRDLRHYQARMPQRVAQVLQRLGQACGMTHAQLLAQEHVLHAFSFTRFVEAWRADYVHSYFFYEQSLFAWVASALLELPRGVSCYADHLLQDYALKAVGLQLGDCSVVIATSRRIRGELEALHGAPLDSVLVKPNAIDTSSFAGRDGTARAQGAPLRLLSVCRLDPKKGLEYLIEAVRLLDAGGQAVALCLVGEADPHNAAAAAYAQGLKSASVELQARGAVRFLGQCDSVRIRQELQQADVFVAPFVELPNGDKDGIPTAVLEAMAAGCAIVATDAGSIPEIVEHDREALLVPQRDPAALAEAIGRLLREPETARRLAQGATARARAEFDVVRCEQPFHAAVRACVASPRRPAAATAGSARA